jgi:beta-lactamase regulating signal transducer with metallopeptidase domain
MTLAWIVYVLAFSLAIASAAYIAERVGALPRAGSRWIWAAAMVISIMIPTSFAWLSVGSMPEYPTGGATLARTAPAADTSARWVMVSGGGWGRSVVSEADIEAIWLFLSILLFVWWAVTRTRLRKHARSWIPSEVAGRCVLLSDNVGPAVVGALRARIVAPQWLVEMPRRKQDIVLAHEEEHIAAGDPLLLAAALALLAVMPWNLPLWYQLARLRRAIEVDCDARVLRRGIGVIEYGGVLLDIGSRGEIDRAFGAEIGIALSFLEQRVRIMLQPRHRYWRWMGVCVAGLAIGCIAMASILAPPLPNRVTEDLVRSVAGSYVSAGQQYFIIHKEADGLDVATHGFARRLVPDGRNPFKFKLGGTAATIEFEHRWSGGQASAFTWSDDSGTTRFERANSAVIAAIDETLANRVRARRPYPNGDLILLRNLGLAAHGSLARDDFSPGMVGLLEKYLANDVRAVELAKLGNVRSVRFFGVGSVGTDFYRVEFQRGVVQIEMHMDGAGRVSGLAWHKL